MRKTITFLGLCFFVSILCSKLDAFFAIAIACENHGYHSQLAYKYAYGSALGNSILQVQYDLQQDLIAYGIKNGQALDVIFRTYSIEHGFFAIIEGIFVNSSISNGLISIIGVGVSRKDPIGAISNAREDIKKTIEKINANVLIGAFEENSAELFEFGQF